MKRILLSIGFILFYSIVNAQVAQEWAVRYNNWTQNGNDTAVTMVLDDSANVYVTGVSAGTNGYMDFLTVKYSNSGTLMWTQRFNGAGNWHDYVNAMAIDDSGNVYVTGTSFGGGSTPTNNYLTIKYSRNGVQQWVEEFDRAVNYDEAIAIVTDDSGYVYVTGVAVASTQTDFFTIKYGGNGNIIWTSAFDGPGNQVDYPVKIALDGNYNVYVAGNATSAAMNWDFATVKYNSGGVQQWVSYHDGSLNSHDRLFDMCVAQGGAVYVTGVAPNTAYDYWTNIKYDTNGNQQWVRTWASLETEVPFALAVDSAENVYTTGFWCDWNMSGYVLTMKHDSAGTLQWTRQHVHMSQCIDIGKEIFIDAQGCVYVAGESPSDVNCSNVDYFVIKYDPAGSVLAYARYNGLGNQSDLVSAVLVDSVGSMYLTGGSYGGGTGDDFATVKYSIITSGPPDFADNELNVSPNPSNGLYSVFTECAEFQIAIYNVEGRLIKSQKNDRNLDITSEPDGIYFIHLYDGDGNVHVQKLVKTSTE